MKCVESRHNAEKKEKVDFDEDQETNGLKCHVCFVLQNSVDGMLKHIRNEHPQECSIKIRNKKPIIKNEETTKFKREIRINLQRIDENGTTEVNEHENRKNQCPHCCKVFHSEDEKFPMHVRECEIY